MKLHQRPVFIDGMVNSTEVVVREGRSKVVVVAKTIDAVRQLILQDRYVTYREIEATLGISGTSIHSMLHEHLTVKNFFSRWIPHNLSIVLIGRKKCSKNTIVVLRNTSMTSLQVKVKVYSSRLYGCFKMS